LKNVLKSRVKEVFIVRKLNWKDKGIYEVHGSAEPKGVQKQLDSIYIGNMKIHVNMPTSTGNMKTIL